MHLRNAGLNNVKQVPFLQSLQVPVYVTVSRSAQHMVCPGPVGLENCFPRTISSSECFLDHVLGKAGSSPHRLTFSRILRLPHSPSLLSFLLTAQHWKYFISSFSNIFMSFFPLQLCWYHLLPPSSMSFCLFIFSFSCKGQLFILGESFLFISLSSS